MLAYKLVGCDRIQGSHDHVSQEFHKSLKTQCLARIPFHKHAKYFRRKCPTSVQDRLYGQYNGNIIFPIWHVAYRM